MSDNYPHVNSEIRVGNLRIRNRITRTAHGTGYAIDGKVTERLIAYHEARARGGVGSLFLETCGVHPTSPGPLWMFRDDIVEGLVRVMARPGAPDPQWKREAPDSATSSAPYRLYNIGNHSSVELLHFIGVIEDCLGRKAAKRFLAAQPGDVLATAADVSELTRDVGFEPNTPIETGLRRFIDWYRAYYGA